MQPVLCPREMVCFLSTCFNLMSLTESVKQPKHPLYSNLYIDSASNCTRYTRRESSDRSIRMRFRHCDGCGFGCVSLGCYLPPARAIFRQKPHFCTHPHLIPMPMLIIPLLPVFPLATSQTRTLAVDTPPSPPLPHKHSYTHSVPTLFLLLNFLPITFFCSSQ